MAPVLPASPHSAPHSFPVPGPPQLDDTTKDDLLQLGNNQSFLTLFQHGALTTIIVTGYHTFQCPLCDSHVSTSIPSTVLLTSAGQFHALMTHYRKKPCLATVARKEKGGIAAILQSMGTVAHLSSSPVLPTAVRPNSQGLIRPNR